MSLSKQEEVLLARHLSVPTSNESGSTPLVSGLSELDHFFARKGGLCAGKITEWGIPEGRYGRPLILKFLRGFLSSIVWVYGGRAEACLYPPAWAEQGIDLSKLFFIQAKRPLPELRPLFLGKAFKVVVLDSPERLSPGDWSFLSAQVRANHQFLFVLRPFFLSQKLGNPLAHFRLNCWARPRQGHFVVKALKGGEGLFHFPLTRVRSHENRRFEHE